MQRFSALVSALVLCLTVWAQSPRADSLAVTSRYSAMIEMPKAYLSGVCIVKCQNDTVTGCLFNEFGISALEFTFKRGDKNARLLGVASVLDKWYIKRVLRRDLVLLYENLENGDGFYRNSRHNISYRLTPLNHDAPEE